MNQAFNHGLSCSQFLYKYYHHSINNSFVFTTQNIYHQSSPSNENVKSLRQGSKVSSPSLPLILLFIHKIPKQNYLMVRMKLVLEEESQVSTHYHSSSSPFSQGKFSYQLSSYYIVIFILQLVKHEHLKPPMSNTNSIPLPSPSLTFRTFHRT